MPMPGGSNLQKFAPLSDQMNRPVSKKSLVRNRGNVNQEKTEETKSKAAVSSSSNLPSIKLAKAPNPVKSAGGGKANPKNKKDPMLPKISTNNPTPSVSRPDEEEQKLEPSPSPDARPQESKSPVEKSILEDSVTAAPVTVNADPIAISEPVSLDPPPPVLIPPQNGKVKLLYETYDEEFEIVNGSTTQENIDEVYCLSFVMPGCKIHLSKYSPAEKRLKDINGDNDSYIQENSPGTYIGLMCDETYYVYAEEVGDKTTSSDTQNQSRVMATQRREEEGRTKDDGRVLESCSCIYGNPCVVSDLPCGTSSIK